MFKGDRHIEATFCLSYLLKGDTNVSCGTEMSLHISKSLSQGLCERD